MSLLENLQRSLSEFGRPLGAALGERDTHTQSHCDRVVGIADTLARACALHDDEIAVLRLCASFHDNGKIGIPDRVLLKAAGFDEEEWRIMREHPVIGERILRNIELDGVEAIASAVRHHHEHFDGSGYPDGLSGENIPLYARFVSIADSYDAMLSARPYHRARTHAEVMHVLHAEAGIKHDPLLLHAFSRIPPHQLNG